MYNVLIMMMTMTMVLVRGSLGCPSACTCIWKQGKQTVECVDKALISIPEGIRSTTQVLDLTGNNFQILPKLAFRRAGLGDLQKIYLAKCKLGHIDPTSFSHLSNLVELDLSVNLLTMVPSKTFKDFPLLRRLVLSENPIQKVANEAFIDLTSLSNLELSGCQIETIEPRAFVGLEHLQYLKIERNNLFTIRVEMLLPLTSLYGLELHGNPWTCDCKLRSVRKWMMRHNVPYGIPPRCKTPHYVQDLTWDRMELDDFACVPDVWQPVDVRIKAVEGTNATIACRIRSVPEAEIHWSHDNRPISNRTMLQYGKPRYVIQEVGNYEKTSYLTIISAIQRDNGSYLCTAENNAGRVTTNFSLAISLRELDAGTLTTPQVAGIILGIILILLIVICIVCIMSARWRHNTSNPRSKVIIANSTNHIKSKDIEANCVPVDNDKNHIIKENSNYSNHNESNYSHSYSNQEPNIQANVDNGQYMSPERTVSTNYNLDIGDISYPTYPRNKSAKPQNEVSKLVRSNSGSCCSTSTASTERAMNNARRCLPEIPQKQRTTGPQFDHSRSASPPAMSSCVVPDESNNIISSTYSLDRLNNSSYGNYSRQHLDEYYPDVNVNNSSKLSLNEHDESYGSYYPSPSLRTSNVCSPRVNKYSPHAPPSAAHLHMLEIGGHLGGVRDSPDEGYDEEGDEGTEV